MNDFCSHFLLLRFLLLSVTMGKTYPVGQTQRGMIWGLSLAGVPQKEIAERVGCGLCTVQRMVARCKAEGFEEGLKTKKNCGRKTIVTEEMLAALRRFVKDHPFSTAVEVKRKVREVRHLSVRRIREAFQIKLKMPIRRAAPKPLLNKRMVAKRLQFCHDHLHWTADDWNKIMFSDESMFVLLRSRMKLVRRPVKERFNPKFCSPTVKHSPSVMVWGVFSRAKGGEGIFFHPPNVKMNASSYIQVKPN